MSFSVACFISCAILLLSAVQAVYDYDFAPEVDISAAREQPVRYLCSGIGTDLEKSEKYPWWLPKLEDAAIFRSSKPRKRLEITLVEPLSIERLEPLRMQCSVWPGAIAVAIYLPVSQGRVVSDSPKYNTMDMQKAIDHIKAEYDILSEGCALDVGIFVEQLNPGREKDPFLGYPNNAMRNKALELADTELVLLLDGDFVPGPFGFVNEIFDNPSIYEKLLTTLQGHAVIVVESLDVDSEKWIDGRAGQITFDERLQRLVQGVHATKPQVVKMVERQVLHNFRPECHQETDWSRWLVAEDMYTVQYNHTNRWPSLYEPYIIGLRKDLPWWDERFRGYFFNKHSYTYSLYRFNFTFVVLPDMFVIHYPHLLKNDVGAHMDTPDYKRKHDLYWGTLPNEHMYYKEAYRPVRTQDPQHCKDVHMQRLPIRAK